MKNLFENLKRENRAALAIFITCGDPDLGFTEKLVERVCASGADIMELGVPFSDPMADGKTIQMSSARAIKSGATFAKVLDMVARLRAKGVDKKFVLFSYFNPIFHYGTRRAAEMSKEAGVDAWLVVDVPMEESGEIRTELAPLGLGFIPLAAPTSSLKRVREISEHGGGFLYYVSVAGVTGARNALPEGFAERINGVRKASKLPVGVGFGISTPEMAAQVAAVADAVIVGSKFVDTVHRAYVEGGESAALDAAEKFVAPLAAKMGR